MERSREMNRAPGSVREHPKAYEAPSNVKTPKHRERDYMPHENGSFHMKPNRSVVLEILYRDLEELSRKAEIRLQLVMALIEEEKQRCKEAPCDDHLCGGGGGDGARLKAALHEAIDVLEQSRKSFKSKQLEGLRKHLVKVLMESQ